MIVHSDNRPVKISDTNGKAFVAACSHIESLEGKHLFVIAITPGKEAKDLLVNSRSDLSSFVKQGYGVRSNNDLDYMEVQSDGNLFRVNLDNLGHGPGIHGEPEHLKSRGDSVSQATVLARLGNVGMPVPSPAPLTSERDEHDVVCSPRTVPLPSSVLALEGGSGSSRKERVIYESWTDERRANRRNFTRSGKGR